MTATVFRCYWWRTNIKPALTSRSSCAMYVDKRLRGVNAVQTLSRLNRICAPYDKKTFVLDFKNEYEDIQAAFAPFYTETILNETITPSDIRAVEAQVDQVQFPGY